MWTTICISTTIIIVSESEGSSRDFSYPFMSSNWIVVALLSVVLNENFTSIRNPATMSLPLFRIYRQ